MTVVALENLGKELNKVLHDLDMDLKRLVAKEAMDLPRQFEVEAKRFYPSVLKQPTGQLINSFEQVARQEGDNWVLGLRSDKEYATIQHEGGQTAPHEILPRRKKALMWPGASHPVRRVRHPGSRIKAKYFFKIPIASVMDRWLPAIKEKIGFRR